jgi:predicted flap endonuclease-1-like 5' DNA nuclease
MGAAGILIDSRREPMKVKIMTAVGAIVAAFGATRAARWFKQRRRGQRRARVARPASRPAGKTGKPVAATPNAPATTGPAAASGPATSNAPATSEPGADDLTAIKGLGKVVAARLVEAGVTSYAQIASWDDQELSDVAMRINVSPGRIRREDWVEQAKMLAKG